MVSKTIVKEVRIATAEPCPNCTCTSVRNDDGRCLKCERSADGAVPDKFRLTDEARELITEFGGLVNLHTDFENTEQILVICRKGVFVTDPGSVSGTQIVWSQSVEGEINPRFSFVYKPEKKIIIDDLWVVAQRPGAEGTVQYEWEGAVKPEDLENTSGNDAYAFKDIMRTISGGDFSISQIASLSAAEYRAEKTGIAASGEKLSWFWQIIDSIVVNHDGSHEDYLRVMRGVLGGLQVSDIDEFQRCYHYYWGMLELHYDLQDAAYLVMGGLSDDGWAYGFVPWLISRGSEVFKAVFDDPERLAAFGPGHIFEFEEFFSEPDEIREKMAGTDYVSTLPEYLLPPGYTGVGSSCDRESYELEDKFPRLFALHFGPR